MQNTSYFVKIINAKMKFDVVTFGSAVVDIFIDTDVAERKGMLCYPLGGKILIKDFKYETGGGATNTAVAFARLGLKTGCISKIGNDNGGLRILSQLKKEKVKFLGKQEKKPTTGFSIILDSKHHRRTILTNKGANNDLISRDIKSFKTKWLYLSSQLGKSFKTQIKIARKHKRKGVKIAFNPSSYLIRQKRLKNLLKIVDVVILNKEESEMLAKSHSNVLEKIHKLGPKIVAITDGPRKIICSDSKKKYSLIPSKVKVVEATGAGDAFAAGFVAGLIKDKPIIQCMKLGLKESESVLQHFGAKNNLLRMKLK